MTHLILTFHGAFEPLMLNASPCVCVCERERETVNITLLNQINQSVPDVHSEAIVRQCDSLLLQTDAEH